ncbi:MAG: DUF2442 domain-containing protein [Hyphomicrobiales bacterium]|nr:DUF2442 domain-containing protein [Hyphomicrobiales bacterium]
MAGTTDMDFKAAEARGKMMIETEPRARTGRYDTTTGRIELELVNGCTYGFPAQLIQDLQGADAGGLAKVEVDGIGFNLHWPDLDVDLYVPALVSGIFGTRDWMTRELARIAGRTTSAAKARAARANGAKGGRPRKIANG